MLAELMQVDERFLNKPDEVAAIAQQLQNKQSLMELANPAGSMPEAPPSPSAQPIATNQ